MSGTYIGNAYPSNTWPANGLSGVVGRALRLFASLNTRITIIIHSAPTTLQVLLFAFIREDIGMNLLITRGKETVAKISNRSVELPDEFSPEGQLVRSIVSLGVPTAFENRKDRWRIQPEDPDFIEALSKHLEQYGLKVEEKNEKV